MEKSIVVSVDGTVDAFAEPLVFRFSDGPLQSVSHDIMTVTLMFLNKEFETAVRLVNQTNLLGLDLIDR